MIAFWYRLIGVLFVFIEDMIDLVLVFMSIYYVDYIDQ